MAYNPLAFGLMLVGTGALLFAYYLFHHFREKIDPQKEKTYGAIFIILGGIAMAFGFNLFVNTPIPDHYIEVYGVGYFVFATLTLVGGLVMLNNWDYRPASVFGALGGVLLVASSYNVLINELSRDPLKTAAIISLSGLGALLTYPLTHIQDVQKRKVWLIITIIVFALAGALAFYGGITAQLGHVERALAASA